MEANKKIELILEYLKISPKVFSERLGYDRPQIIYDIQKGKTKRISEDLAFKISSVFPEIDRIWLLTGEGEMIKDNITQEANGDNNMQIAGNSNNINNSAAIKLALSEISEMRKLLQEQVKNNQDQFNRFMSVIERLTNN